MIPLLFRNLLNRSSKIDTRRQENNNKMATEGIVYCLSNAAMPGILKIGITGNTAEERARQLSTTGVPLPFKVEFAMKVIDARSAETTLHKLLEQYTERISSRREFFRVSVEEVRGFFDLMASAGGAYVQETEPDINTVAETEDIDDSASENNEIVGQKKGCRTMSRCFTHGQRIRHVVGINRICIGTYDAIKDGIVCGDVFYKTISGFAFAHNKVYNPSRKTTNGWTECECEMDGKWIPTHSLAERVS